MNGDFNPDDFETRQEFAISADGTRVPMFIIKRAGAPMEGKSPTLLYGYGGSYLALLLPLCPLLLITPLKGMKRSCVSIVGYAPAAMKECVVMKASVTAVVSALCGICIIVRV